MEAQAKHTSRPRFLKQLGLSLAAGLGIAALTPEVAFASNNCCPRSSSPCIDCEDPLTDYFCDCPDPGGDYCLNQCLSNTGCYSGPC